MKSVYWGGKDCFKRNSKLTGKVIEKKGKKKQRSIDYSMYILKKNRYVLNCDNSVYMSIYIYRLKPC